MFGLRLKSIRLCVSLCFVLGILCAVGGKEGDPQDVPKDDVKDTDPKDVAKEDASNKDEVTKLLESLSPEDIAKLENMTEKEAEKKTVFLSPKEGCDFLGIGSLFDKPDYHKKLLDDYFAMERFGYWEYRCEEIVFEQNDSNTDTAAQKPSYCP